MIDTPLREIARAHGTDKEGVHSYSDAYERHLGRFRNRPITLLEIGIGGYAVHGQGGASLRMWKEYFPLGRIIGLDIQDKSELAEDRITIITGNQTDKGLLERLAADHGPFDVVIDDGSHHSKHVIASFGVLFPHLAEYGLYVIEDLQTAYWETYGGSSDPAVAGTSMAMLKALVDGLNYAEYDVPMYQPTYTDRWISSVAFYHNLAFIEKAPNLDPSSLLPPHPRSGRHFAKPEKPARTETHRRKARSARQIFRSVVPLRVRRVVVRLGRPLLRAVRRQGGTRR